MWQACQSEWESLRDLGVSPMAFALAMDSTLNTWKGLMLAYGGELIRWDGLRSYRVSRLATRSTFRSR